jgi:CubicO group peptidase (beta-lactamase class C family)
MNQMLTTIALLLLCMNVAARDLPTTKAERLGMSTPRLQQIKQINQRYVDEGKIAGISTAVARNGKIVHFETVGSKGVEDARALAKDDLFRIYSMSKPITAAAAMQLYERGYFQLSDPVSKFIPELANLTVMKEGMAVPATNTMTMQQLLSHTAGFSYGFDAQDPVDKLYIEADLWGSANLDDFASKLGKLPLKFEPGEQWHYSVAVDVTGLVVQRLSGQRFDEYLSEHIFKPLGMMDTFFVVPDDKLARFLPNHFLDPETKKPRLLSPEGSSEPGANIFENCRAMCDYQDVTLFSGGGGLVSTTMDYMRFAEAMRNGGTFDGARILSPKTVAYMTTNHLPASIAGGGSGEQPTLVGTALPGFGFGLGFGLVTDTAASSVMGSVGEYYWGGAAGTVFWIDPVEEIVVVSMMQLMGGWPSYRADLKVATYQSLLESYQ